MRRSSILLALTLSILFASSSAGAQTVTDHPRVKQALSLLEVWLEAQRAYQQIPGVSAGVVYDQELLWSGGFGHADVERKVRATPETIYSICSISKLFTSIGVMQLRDAGKLRLDDPVARHIPWFKIKRSDHQGPEVTIEGLLTHSSGLPREADFPYWTGPEFTFPTREQIMERIAGQQTLYPAERYFQYSNLGITLAGELITLASGDDYESYVRKRILDPLGLKSTTSEMPEKERGGRLATGYSALRRDGKRVPVTFFMARGISAAAGYASTVQDLARFASWQFRVLDRKGGEDVLKSNTLREMQRVHWVDPDLETMWGLGFSVWRSEGKAFTGHGGSCPGFRTQLLLKPDEKLATIIMANAQGVNTTEFAQRVYEIVAPAVKAAAKPGTSEPSKQKEELARYAGTYESGFAGEIAIVEWEDGLAALSLPTMDPVRGLMKLRKVGEHTFRRIRKDESLGEALVFEMGADGRAARIIWHSNQYRRAQ
ncbi:MAG TPA: serine hydrolase [Blastocatellia bacterium]|nr:serine hydrolase [Blastocatellia bacterium]